MDSQDIKDYLKGLNYEVEEVQITTCLLNLNSFATVKLKGDIETIKAELDRKKFRGCVLDVKSKCDAESEDAFNRTIAVLSLN